MNLRAELGSIQYGEFLRWLGVWLLIATIQGPARKDYWKKDPVTMFSGAPFRFGEFMSRSRFEDILRSLTLTNKPAPPFIDKFFRIRDIVTAWNDNMNTNFDCGWISCLDESMSVWTNEYTCPGFIFVPRKPHPFGNEWHSICCGITGIMFGIELVEGKDQPKEIRRDFEATGKTVGLLLRMSEPLWGTGKVVVLDSGFCVLQGIIELRKKGVFAAALVKKRRYWPKYVKGELVKEHFENLQVGDVDAWSGIMDDIPFHIYGMKEPEYVMTMMTTYGTLERTGKETERTITVNGVRNRIKFNYPEVIGNHFKFRHMVDDHNAKRHAPISLEESWATKTWEYRVFAFLIAITEVNVMLAAKCLFQHLPVDTGSQLSFRKQFSNALIYNKYIVQEREENVRRSKRRSSNLDHELLTLPRGKKFSANFIVRGNMDYQQYKCSGCIKRTRTYCRCSPGIARCTECYASHYRESDILVSTPVPNSVTRSLSFDHFS
jgi:Transposase IS4